MSYSPPPQQYQYQPVPQTSNTAIISLVAGILGLTVFPIVGSIIAVVCGHIAKNEIARRGGQIGGSGMATAGLVMGYFGLAVLVLGICGFTLAFLGICTLPLLVLPFAGTPESLLPLVRGLI